MSERRLLPVLFRELFDTPETEGSDSKKGLSMSTVNTHETVRGLIALQAIDDEVYRIRRRLAEGPSLVDRRGEKYRTTKSRVDAALDQIKKRKAQVAEIELELKSKEGEIGKVATQQGTARTNQEYKALGDHVERLKKECSDLEDNVLLALGEVEEAEADIQELNERMADAKKEHDAFAGQWAADEAEYQKELAQHEAKRNEHKRSLPEPTVEVYERVLKAREGLAVVPINGKVCSGCQMRLRPNDLARLHTGNELVSCLSCERILYVPEVHNSTAN